MDMYDDSGSDGDSVTLEIERGDAIIVYGCNEQRYSPPPNHVTKVLIGPREPHTSVAEISIFTDDMETVNCSGTANHVCSPFGPPDNHTVSPQPQARPYAELSEALSHLNASDQGMDVRSSGPMTVSPALSRKFRNSSRSEVGPSNNNPFLNDTNAPQTGAFPNGGSAGNLPKPSDPPTGVSPPALNQTDRNPMPLPGDPGNLIAPPGAFQSPDLLGDATNVTTCQTVSSVPNHLASDSSTPLGNTVDSSVNATQPISPDVSGQSQNSNSLPSQSPDPVAPNVQPASNLPNGPGPARVQILNAACSQELPPIQESLNTPDQLESSFNFPEPPRSEPLVCVPVKEVKFEEPPKQIFSALETLAEKLGEIVPITVQPGHTQNSGKSKDQPNVIANPTYSAPPSKKDEPKGSQTTSNQTINNQTESKMNNNIKIQEVRVPSDQANHEEHTHSYGIIGNDDNLSEITLPPAEGGNHRDHDGDPYSNGHGRPCHRIRISIDQQAATPSRRSMAITGLLVVLLISTIILIGVYKFVHKSSPD